MSLFDKRKNLLFINCHDLGRHLSIYGINSVASPSLDKLASESVVFTNCFCTAPGCSPSRASLFTGFYPHQVGVYGLTHMELEGEFNGYNKHLARLLADHGFMTAQFGVMHEAKPDAETVKRLGYEFFNGKFGMPSEKLASEVVSFLNDYKDKRPFFCNVGFSEPHYPWNNQPYREKGVDIPEWLPQSDPPLIRSRKMPTERAEEEFALLQGAILEMDRGVGAILHALEQSGHREDTVIVFTTDHGIAMPRAKSTLYDPGIEVSLIISDPATDSTTGKAVTDLVSNIDVFPTITEMFELPLSPDVPGKSLLPCMSGRDSGRKVIFAEKNWHGGNYDPTRCVRTAEYKFIANFGNNLSGGFIEGNRLSAENFIRFRQHFELYDLKTDPFEKLNLAYDPKHQAVVDAMKKQLLEYMRTTDDPLLRGPIPGYFYLNTMASLGLKPSDKKE
jgi:N-sulfoglucosamine sulfohydrolase